MPIPQRRNELSKQFKNVLFYHGIGQQNKPIIHIEPDNVVIDELHFLLRIGDVLVPNIVH